MQAAAGNRVLLLLCSTLIQALWRLCLVIVGQHWHTPGHALQPFPPTQTLRDQSDFLKSFFLPLLPRGMPCPSAQYSRLGSLCDTCKAGLSVRETLHLPLLREHCVLPVSSRPDPASETMKDGPSTTSVSPMSSFPIRPLFPSFVSPKSRTPASSHAVWSACSASRASRCEP